MTYERLTAYFEAEIPIHVGERGINVEETTVGRVPSDTLYGAILTALSYLEGDDYARALCEEFERGNPPFIVSSALPFVELKDRIIHLLPMPAGLGSLVLEPPARLGQLRSYADWARMLRRCELITPEALHRLMSRRYAPEVPGEDCKEARPETIAGLRELRVGQRVLCTEDENAEIRRVLAETGATLIKREERARNALDRCTRAAVPFYAGVFMVSRPAGLYMLALVRKGMRRVLEMALRAFEDLGVGGERSVGYGLLRLKRCEPGWPAELAKLGEAGKPARALLVGLALPTSDMRSRWRADRYCYVNVALRGGWGGRTWMAQLRSTVLAAAEGSLVPIPDGDPGWLGSCFHEGALYRVFVTCYVKLGVPGVGHAGSS